MPLRRVPPALLSGAARALALAAPLHPALTEKAELARIGHYYATEAMLVLDPATGRYDADATPETGSTTLRDHYAALLQGRDAGLREHADLRRPANGRPARTEARDTGAPDTEAPNDDPSLPRRDAMASKTALNAANLEALGAVRLARLLMELSEGDAAAQRRLRLELAARQGSGEVARAVRRQAGAGGPGAGLRRLVS